MARLESEAYIGIGGQSESFNFSSYNKILYINAGDQRDVILGGQLDDTIFGGLGADLIAGYAGRDVIYGDRDWTDVTSFEVGTTVVAADLILGDNGQSNTTAGGNDIIYAGAGKNYVNGEGGDDFIVGGWDNEFLQGGSGQDAILGLNGDDIIFGGTGSKAQQDNFVSSNFVNSNTGSFMTLFNGKDDTSQAITWQAISYTGQIAVDVPGAPEYLSRTGDDYLDGGKGNDILYGQDGVDFLLGGDGNDTLDGGTGNDYLNGGEGNDFAYAGDGDDVIEGGRGFDWLVADAGNDTIQGGEGNDVMSGGLGNDYLIGGQGYDLMYGGDGNDVFEIRKGDLEDIAFGEAGLDTANFIDRTSSEVASRGVASNGYYTVVFKDGSYTSLSGVEYLAFSDTSLFIG